MHDIERQVGKGALASISLARRNEWLPLLAQADRNDASNRARHLRVATRRFDSGTRILVEEVHHIDRQRAPAGTVCAETESPSMADRSERRHSGQLAANQESLNILCAIRHRHHPRFARTTVRSDIQGSAMRAEHFQTAMHDAHTCQLHRRVKLQHQ